MVGGGIGGPDVLGRADQRKAPLADRQRDRRGTVARRAEVQVEGFAQPPAGQVPTLAKPFGRPFASTGRAMA